ncbi:hypothetical protein ANCCAN_12583 [Ancylostoma caninum]|uniref:SXP/RAL-2 family protein Ani s 5-like cation-binding domain-containing protein n=1 Tax=Ancylostoma caninum TaxID=29170 RepID=A0A368GAM2_ANCCA|nr:hypothetical protein ANCCAN_12583 [Ancylostoma caninum]
MNTFLLALIILGVAECGRHEMKKLPRFPEPPFLKNMTREAKREYHDILRKRNETIATQKQQVLAWAKNHGIEAQVREFDAELNQLKAQQRENVTALLAELPQAYQRLNEIKDNENQTPIQLKEALDKFQNSNKMVYEVLMFASGRFPPRIRPQGPRRPWSKWRRGEATHTLVSLLIRWSIWLTQPLWPKSFILSKDI